MATFILLSVIVPGVIATVIIAVGAIAGRRMARPKQRTTTADGIRNAAGALAVGAGFLFSFAIIEGVPTMPPHARWHWLAYMALAATVIGCLHGLWARRSAGTFMTGGLLAMAAALMLQPLPAVEHHWLWKIGLGAAVLVLWLSMHGLARRRPGHLLPLAMVIVFTAASIVLVEARIAKFGQLAGALAAICGGIMMVSLLARQASLVAGTSVVLVMLLPAWMVTGHLYDQGDVPLAAFALIACAPLAMWIGQWPLVDRLGGWQAWCVRVGVVLAVAAIGVGLALTQSAPPLEPYEW